MSIISEAFEGIRIYQNIKKRNEFLSLFNVLDKTEQSNYFFFVFTGLLNVLHSSLERFFLH